MIEIKDMADYVLLEQRSRQIVRNIIVMKSVLDKMSTTDFCVIYISYFGLVAVVEGRRPKVAGRTKVPCKEDQDTAEMRVVPEGTRTYRSILRLFESLKILLPMRLGYHSHKIVA